MTALFNKYRPQNWEQVVGQDRAVATLKRLVASGSALGQAFFVMGARGTGKSSIAQLLASDLADDFNIEERDAQWCTAARLDELERSLRYRPIGAKPGRVIIINEGHKLSDAAIGQFLTWLERLPDWVAVIFTAPTDEMQARIDGDKDVATFFSRCFPVELSQRGLAEAFAKRVQEIAQAEGLDGQPIEKYVRMVKDCRNNCRMAIQRIAAGEMLAGGAE